MVGPGIGSARSNRAASSDLAEVLGAEELGQAGDLGAAARGLRRAARRPGARLSSGSVEQRIWIRPTVNGCWLGLMAAGFPFED